MDVSMSQTNGGGDHAVDSPGDMTIFRYDKTLLTRLNECKDALKVSEKPVPACKVREEWSYFAEVQVEPAGTLARHIDKAHN